LVDEWNKSDTTSFLEDVRIHVCIQDRLQNLDVIAIRASATFEKMVYSGEHNLAPVWRNRICSITTDGTSNMTGQSQGIASACNMMHFLDSKD
jgi:hypothetical protein